MPPFDTVKLLILFVLSFPDLEYMVSSLIWVFLFLLSFPLLGYLVPSRIWVFYNGDSNEERKKQ